MKYILDASVAVKWVLREPDSSKAIALRDDARNGVCELVVPETFPVEIAHALTRAERRGVIPTGDAMLKVVDILSTKLELHSCIPLLPRAIKFSSQLRIGVYDCLYVALAEREQCDLVTADLRLVSVVQNLISVVPLSTL
ncbi:MAG: type II toxin-antitoxin system VapC family toxin [Planctomycetaceae bacterium]|nr:type II toxin-antitoxin system VapC family toxin [Planctomycetaceae bacterium]